MKSLKREGMKNSATQQLTYARWSVLRRRAAARPALVVGPKPSGHSSPGSLNHCVPADESLLASGGKRANQEAANLKMVSQQLADRAPAESAHPNRRLNRAAKYKPHVKIKFVWTRRREILVALIKPSEYLSCSSSELSASALSSNCDLESGANELAPLLHLVLDQFIAIHWRRRRRRSRGRKASDGSGEARGGRRAGSGSGSESESGPWAKGGHKLQEAVGCARGQLMIDASQSIEFLRAVYPSAAHCLRRVEQNTCTEAVISNAPGPLSCGAAGAPLARTTMTISRQAAAARPLLPREAATRWRPICSQRPEQNINNLLVINFPTLTWPAVHVHRLKQQQPPRLPHGRLTNSNTHQEPVKRSCLSPQWDSWRAFEWPIDERNHNRVAAHLCSSLVSMLPMLKHASGRQQARHWLAGRRCCHLRRKQLATFQLSRRRGTASAAATAAIAAGTGGQQIVANQTAEVGAEARRRRPREAAPPRASGLVFSGSQVPLKRLRVDYEPAINQEAAAKRDYSKGLEVASVEVRVRVRVDSVGASGSDGADLHGNNLKNRFRAWGGSRCGSGGGKRRKSVRGVPKWSRWWSSAFWLMFLLLSLAQPPKGDHRLRDGGRPSAESSGVTCTRDALAEAGAQTTLMLTFGQRIFAAATPPPLNSKVSAAMIAPAQRLLRVMNERFAHNRQQPASKESSTVYRPTRFIKFTTNSPEEALHFGHQDNWRGENRSRRSSNGAAAATTTNETTTIQEEQDAADGDNSLAHLATYATDVDYEQQARGQRNFSGGGASAGSDDAKGPSVLHRWPVISLVSFMFIGASGNILVCLAVWRERRLQTATNYFLLSLAVADLLVCVLVMPFGIIYEFYGE